MRILVVDDDPTVLKSCQRVLEAEGFDVYLVPSADKAIEAMRNDDFALLLVDIKMPQRDGIYLMSEIEKEWPHIPIIVMSGYGTEQTVQQAMETGAASFIAKPFTPTELLNALQKVLEKPGDHN
jgi:DNA-binding NtrC family response regulator